MEFLLQSLLKGSKSFLQVLDQAENFSEFETGLLLGIEQNGLGADFVLLNVLRKVWVKKKDLQGIIFMKYVKVFLEVLQSVNEENFRHLMENIIDELEFIGLNGEGLDSDIKKKCFVASKNVFVGKIEAIKLLGVGFDFVDQDILNREQAKVIGRVLNNNIEEIEISEGCRELEQFGIRLVDKDNKELYDLFIEVLVYLCEVKAGISHTGELERIINSQRGFIKEADRERVSSALIQLRKRVGLKELNEVKNPEKIKADKILETEILKIVEKASNHFFTHNSLDITQLYKDFNQINHKPSPNLLFKIVSDMIYYDEPSPDNFKYWSQFLEALKTLPNLSKPKFSELQTLVSRLTNKPNPNSAPKHPKKPAEKKPPALNPLKVPAKPSSIQAEYQSLSAYHSQLSESALSLIKDFSLTAPILEEINEATKQLRLSLKAYSHSYNLKFIGSAVIGTYIRDSSVDILVQDSLKPPSAYIMSLNSVILKPESIFLVNIPRSKYTFCVYTENLLQVETSALIKKYCQMDARINELLIFVKIWVKNWNLNVLSGFHWTILTLVFILNTEPCIVPNLQHKKHTEKLINGFDAWFDSEYSQASSNYWSLGELIFHFFHFFCENMEFVADLKTGKFLEGRGEKLEALHPFTGQRVSPPLNTENEKLIENAFKATFELLVKSEPILNILNFH